MKHAGTNCVRQHDFKLIRQTKVMSFLGSKISKNTREFFSEIVIMNPAQIPTYSLSPHPIVTHERKRN